MSAGRELGVGGLDAFAPPFDRATIASAGRDLVATLHHFLRDSTLPLSSLRGRLALGGR